MPIKNSTANAIAPPGRQLQVFSAFAGLTTVLVGVLVLAGWVFDVSSLRRVLPSAVEMKTNTAIGLLCLSVSLLLVVKRRGPSRRAGPLFAAAAAGIGVLILAQYSLGIGLGIDELFLRDPRTPPDAHPGRMSPVTAAAFVLLGLALILLDAPRRRGGFLAQPFALAVAVLALAVLIGHAYGAEPLYRFGLASAVAVHTAGALLVLALGVLAARPDRGLMALVTARTAGGALIRRQVPVVVLVLVLFGWMRSAGQEAGLYGTAFGTALSVTATLLVLGGLIAATGWSLHRLDLERREAEAAVRGQRELYLATVTSIGDAVIATDSTGRVTLLNPAAEKLTGWSQADAAGRRLEEVFVIVGETTREPVGNPAQRALVEGRVVALENPTVLVSKGGVERIIEDSAAPIRDGSAAVVGTVLVFRDASVRRRHERELESREREFRTLAESIPQLAWMARPDGHIFWYNRRWYEYTGTRPEEVEGWGWQSVHDPAALEKVVERWRESIAGGEPFEMTFPLRGADGAFRPFLTRIVPVSDDEGRVARWFGTNTDVSDLARAEGRLREERERLAFALAAADLGQWELDLRDGTAVRTPRHDQIFGYGTPLPEWTYDTFLEHVVPEDRADVDAKFRAAVAAGSLWNVECRIRRSDGAERWIWTKARIQRDAGGTVERMLGLVGDQTDRRGAEASERVATERLRLAMTAARMVSFDFDPTTGSVVNSDNAAEVFGLPPGVGLGEINRGFAQIHPDDVDRHRSLVAGAVERAEGYVSRFRFVRPDNAAVVWMEEHGHAVRGLDGAVRLVGIVMDMTARHEVEAERDDLLRRVQSERGRLAEVFRQAPAFLCVLRGPEHVFEMANDRYDQLVGHRDLVGRTVRGAFPEVEEQGFIGLLDGVYRTGEPFVGTGVRLLFTQHPGQPADERYVDFVYQALRDSDGAVTGVVVVGVDVTQRVRQEKELEDSRRTLYALVERCPFGIYIVDADFRIASINSGSQAGAFANVRPVVGRPFEEAMRIIWPEAVAADVVGRFRHTLETGEPYFSKDFVNPRADIEQVEGYEWELHRLNFAGGRPGVVCYYYDSTQLRRAEQQLKEADRRKDEFLATLAHELRNPLAPIRNGLQVIRMAGANGTIEQARSMMERQLTQMVRLVDDLLDVSRISRGKIELRRERLEVRAVIDAALETSRPLIEQAGHDLAVDVPDEPLFVDGDATRLAQVVSNLLTNSAKYTLRGGHIRLAVRRDGDAVAVTVADDGIGIPPDMLDKVFVMFSQVDRALEKTTGGLGIGLSLVKGLVGLHGGTIEAKSAGEGKGSEFVLRLPAAPDASGSMSPGTDDEPTVPKSLLRILIVDDNRDGADSLGMMLELMGNQVRTAYDGQEGVEAAAEFRPDVALFDIGLPKLNGYQACRCIRQQPWADGLVLIALTGWGQDEDRRRSAEAGFDHHMVKPVDPKALMKLLEELQADAHGK